MRLAPQKHDFNSCQGSCSGSTAKLVVQHKSSTLYRDKVLTRLYKESYLTLRFSFIRSIEFDTLVERRFKRAFFQNHADSN